MKSVKTSSAQETKLFAKNLAKDFTNGGVIALTGELGAGKTTFAQGFAQGLNISNSITSPTFLIIKQYPVPNQTNYFYHIDLYRLENIDLKNSGLEEILIDPTNVVLIEWAEKLQNSLPENALRIELRRRSEDKHEIILA